MSFRNDTSQGNASMSLTTTEDVNRTWERVRLIVPYTIIFLLAVLGNGLVIVTLAVHKKMRTVTNLFLLNLAVSDLLLGVFCMPFTLTGVLFREFIFGSLMCRLIPYLQAVSVCVSAWTLVAMSVERYYAICHPLRSRRWQTLRHARRTITAIWTTSLAIMLPVALLSHLLPIRDTGKVKCREQWGDPLYEQLFTLFLDALLLILPLVGMILTYSSIAATIQRAMRNPDQGPLVHLSRSESRRSFHSLSVSTLAKDTVAPAPSFGQVIRAHHKDRAGCLARKQRVIQMLFVVVVEFFVCWTPLYVVNTWSLFDPAAIYWGLGYQGISLLQLLAYASSCCNPITYCFMNRTFRSSFLQLFACPASRRHAPPSPQETTKEQILSTQGNSIRG